MNAPTKSAPIKRGDLSPEDAERFASLFRPVWDLDDAPFAQAKGGLSPADMQQLGKAGVVPDVQLAQNGSFAAAGPHAPPASQRGQETPDTSIVVDVDMDPTPPPPAKPPVPQNRPVQAKPAVPPAPVSRPRRSAPPAAVRAQLGATDDDLAPAKKSNTGMFIGLGVVALLAIGGIGYKVLGSDKPAEAAKPVTTETARMEPRIPPPPPVVDTTAETPKVDTPAVTAKVDTPAVTAKVDTPAVTAKVDPPPPPPKNTATATAKADPPKPPPPKSTATGGGTKPPPKGPGGGIVRDNPF